MLVDEGSVIRQTSIHSNIVWSASKESPPVEMEVLAREELNIVNEEEGS